MRKFVICQNIDRYRRLLANETNEARRRMLERLLAEEEEIWELMKPDGTRGNPGDKPAKKLNG